MYDAWAAYDPVAIGTQLGDNLQVSTSQITPENKSTAISYAAYTTLLDLFPTQEPAFTHLMEQLGLDSTISSTNTNTPPGIGNLVAKTLLNNKYTDGSNQLNNYTDTSNYQPVRSHPPVGWVKRSGTQLPSGFRAGRSHLELVSIFKAINLRHSDLYHLTFNTVTTTTVVFCCCT